MITDLDFQAVKRTISAVNDRWPAVILSADFILCENGFNDLQEKEWLLLRLDMYENFDLEELRNTFLATRKRERDAL